MKWALEATCIALLALAACSPARAPQDAGGAYYVGADVSEIVAGRLAPAEAESGRNVMSFDDEEQRRSWVYVGPFGSRAEAAQSGARLDEPIVATLVATPGALVSDKPGDGARRVYYRVITSSFADGREARAFEIVDTYVLPALASMGREAIVFRGVDTLWDERDYIGRFDSAAAAGALWSEGWSEDFIAAIGKIAGGEDKARALESEFNDLIATSDSEVTARLVAAD